MLAPRWPRSAGATLLLAGLCLLLWREVRHHAGAVKSLHWIVDGAIGLPLRCCSLCWPAW